MQCTATNGVAVQGTVSLRWEAVGHHDSVARCQALHGSAFVLSVLHCNLMVRGPAEAVRGGTHRTLAVHGIALVMRASLLLIEQLI